jgi:hypothetical protein
MPEIDARQNVWYTIPGSHSFYESAARQHNVCRLLSSFLTDITEQIQSMM